MKLKLIAGILAFSLASASFADGYVYLFNFNDPNDSGSSLPPPPPSNGGASETPSPFPGFTESDIPNNITTATSDSIPAIPANNDICGNGNPIKGILNDSQGFTIYTSSKSATLRSFNENDDPWMDMAYQVQESNFGTPSGLLGDNFYTNDSSNINQADLRLSNYYLDTFGNRAILANSYLGWIFAGNTTDNRLVTTSGLLQPNNFSQTVESNTTTAAEWLNPIKDVSKLGRSQNSTSSENGDLILLKNGKAILAGATAYSSSPSYLKDSFGADVKLIDVAQARTWANYGSPLAIRFDGVLGYSENGVFKPIDTGATRFKSFLPTNTMTQVNWAAMKTTSGSIAVLNSGTTPMTVEIVPSSNAGAAKYNIGGFGLVAMDNSKIMTYKYIGNGQAPAKTWTDVTSYVCDILR